MKDIAVVNGQTARFECIVECNPHPHIEWFKNGSSLRDSSKYVIEFRNGVCRLTIPEAYLSKLYFDIVGRTLFIECLKYLADDAGRYSCTGSNEVGTTSTAAELVVESDLWGARK